jgi:hypothetical protein
MGGINDPSTLSVPLVSVFSLGHGITIHVMSTCVCKRHALKRRKKAQMDLVWKPEEKRALGRPRHR